MANRTSAPANIKELAKCIKDISIGIMGDPGVGKSCLYKRFVGSQIDTDKYKDASIWVDFDLKISTPSKNGLRLGIWDSPSFEECATFIISTPSYACGNEAHGMILVYDCTNQESFDNLNNWLDVIDHNSSYPVPKLLVGNKSDLIDKRAVDYATAKEYADRRGIPLVETSAARDINVNLALKMMITNLCQRQPEKMQRKKKQDQEQWQRMIDDSKKPQEKMQREKEQQQMILRKRKLEEKEQLKKERQLMRQLKRQRIEDERRAKKWQEIIQQRRKQQAKERQKRMQQHKDQKKREQQRREESEKDQLYMMQLLILLLERFPNNNTSPEHLSETVAAEMRTDVGFPLKKEMEISNIHELDQFEEEKSIVDQEIREYEEAMSVFNKHSPFEKNAVHERLFFHNMQREGRETIAQYATRLKERAKSCEFGTTIDEHVRDQILASCRSTKMLEKFLDEGAKLTLERLLEIGSLLENTDE